MDVVKRPRISSYNDTSHGPSNDSALTLAEHATACSSASAGAPRTRSWGERLAHAGVLGWSIRYSASVFHLWHERPYVDETGHRAEPGAARRDPPHRRDLDAGGDLAPLKGAASATAPWINQTEVRIQP